MPCRGGCSDPKFRTMYEVGARTGRWRRGGTRKEVGVYVNGRKTCKNCDISLKYEGRFCPCCNVLLAHRPMGRHKRPWIERQKELS
ncbi:MAG: hypothetical protein MPK62_01340 [Alphaproteobacteria bacterium]|nr:hypothetical protein [Alphaproteobacteria bacterium]